MKSQENCKFQCLRLSKSYACLRNKECYECRKLEHRELLESYPGMFQIRVFAPLGKVSILQIASISQIKHIATSQNTLQPTSIRGVQEDMCVLILVHVLQIGKGCAPPTPPLFRNASTIQNKTTYERSRSQCVLIFVHAFQMEGAAPPAAPPAICACKCVAQQIQVCKKLRVDIFVQKAKSYHTCTRTACSHYIFRNPASQAPTCFVRLQYI